MKPQWKQARSLAGTLRGNPDEFEKSDCLELKPDQNGYSAFRLNTANQIADAFVFIKGRTRYLGAGAVVCGKLQS